MDYTAVAREILEYIGGEKNINEAFHCVTRLRFNLKDHNNINREAIRSVKGVIGVIESGGQLQVVIGSEVDCVYKALISITHLEQQLKVEAKPKKGDLVNIIFDFIAGCFTPLIFIFAGSGLLQGILAMLLDAKLIEHGSVMYNIWHAAGNSGLYFMPVLLGFTAANKLGANPFIGAVLGAALLHPSYTAMVGNSEMLLLSFPVNFISYASQGFPAIFAAITYFYFEKAVNKFMPNCLKLFITPFLVLLIIIPTTILLIGPIIGFTTTLVGDGFNYVYSVAPWLTGILFGGLWFILTMFGLHWGIVPLFYIQFANDGYMTLMPLVFASVYAQIGAALGAYLSSKDRSFKIQTFASLITGSLTGITEPIIYGVLFKDKRNFLPVVISGAISGLLVALLGMKFRAQTMGGLLSFPAFMGGPFIILLYTCTVAVSIGMAATWVYFNNKKYQSM